MNTVLLNLALAILLLYCQLSHCQYCPDKLVNFDPFLSNLNFSVPGLTDVQVALKHGNREQACQKLCGFYASTSTASWWRQHAPVPTNQTAKDAAHILNDTYTFYGDTVRVPRLADGGLDWNCTGPHNDPQWMLALNRHGFFTTLLEAWLQTGNPIYSKFFADTIADWLRYSLPIKKASWNPDWLTLDSGIRMMGPWPETFFGFQNAPEFNCSTRLAMAATSALHADYLIKYPSSNTNWDATQSSGLTVTAVTHPELLNSSHWLEFALNRTAYGLKSRVYPDGIENEMTSGYHLVAARSFWNVLDTLALANKTSPLIRSLRSRVEEMYSFTAWSQDQRGYGALNGDTDLKPTTTTTLEQAATFNRSDWLYIATNGLNGTKPNRTASIMFPWGGELIMRTGFTKEDSWGWFGIGPFGSSGHAHRDKLHLSIRALGQHFLVDSGRFAYEGKDAHYRTDYGSLTQGHNVIMMDGSQQVTVPAIATQPISPASFNITEEYVWASSSITFEGLEDTKHARAVAFYPKENNGTGYWLVLDRLVAGKARTFDALWHTHPTCNATFASANVTRLRCNTGATLSIIGGPCELTNRTVVRGQTEPLQGWYSPIYETVMATDTVIYSGAASHEHTFAWLLYPSPTDGIVTGSVELLAITEHSATIRAIIPDVLDVTQTIALED